MKPIVYSSFFCIYLLFACNQVEKSKTESNTNTNTEITDNNVKNDENLDEIQVLVRKMYEWLETKSSAKDFEPLLGNDRDLYKGIDLLKHEKRISELRTSGFFTDGFIDNYDKIGLKIEYKLRSNEMEWAIGELPPFGNDANPWCNCQDNPDMYWQKLKIIQLEQQEGTANFAWTWGDNFEYKIKTEKVNGKWKIAFMQGFNIEDI